jgi:hypothetical protein
MPMKRLNKEQIQNIETYLENSDVRFADIRLEMTDHVASVIEDKINAGDERDFYYIFKDYMVENKDQLLEDNKRFIKLADKKIRKQLLKNTLKFQTLACLILTALGSYYLLNLEHQETIKPIMIYGPMFLMLFVYIVYGLGITMSKLTRFSALERMIIPYLIVFQSTSILFNWLRKSDIEGAINTVLTISTACMLTIIFILVKTSVNSVLTHREAFKNVI